MLFVDYLIVALYLIAMITVGIIFQRKAARGIDSYFLGDRRLPWWVLGASGMASNLDVSGTMINVAMIYTLGAMGFFVEIRGGIVLIMAFLMIYMGKWNRRANVMTMAEWMQLRFGSGREGKIARLITAIGTLVTTIWIVTYFAVGAGKFIGEFLGMPPLAGLPSEFWAASLMISLAMIYTVTSGLYGVVWTDVFQGILIMLTIIIVTTISVTNFDIPEHFTISVPLSEGGYALVQTTREQWTNIWPQWQHDFPVGSSYSVYNLFGLAIIFYMIKVVIEGSAGTGGYMIQRFYAARSDREAGLLSLFWNFLLAFRWPFIAAIAIMGVSLLNTGGSVAQDPETILPLVINKVIPSGLKGFLVAGLMAAAMSTFDSIVNAGASYWVRDIYQEFINPGASDKRLILQSRLASVIIVLCGLFFTLNVRNLNDLWAWLTMGIGSGMLIPLLLRWYWWRLNGYGFAAGVASGMIAAILQRLLAPDLAGYFAFLIISIVSLSATFIVSLMSRPTAPDVIEKFYLQTRPFGFWKPVTDKLTATSLRSVKTENRNDIIAVIFAVPWQLVLFMTLMMVVFKSWQTVGILLIILLFLSTGLYYFWYRHLSDKAPGMEISDRQPS